jgi:hypothetical protein
MAGAIWDKRGTPSLQDLDRCCRELEAFPLDQKASTHRHPTTVCKHCVDWLSIVKPKRTDAASHHSNRQDKSSYESAMGELRNILPPSCRIFQGTCTPDVPHLKPLLDELLGFSDVALSRLPREAQRHTSLRALAGPRKI